jgi:dynein heavy chain
MLAAAAQMTYLGPFTPTYRQKILAQIASELSTNSILHSPNPTLGLLFHEPLDEGLWIKNQLPRDKTSLENAIMVLTATPLPIIIDPQGQASR